MTSEQYLKQIADGDAVLTVETSSAQPVTGVSVGKHLGSDDGAQQIKAANSLGRGVVYTNDSDVGGVDGAGGYIGPVNPVTSANGKYLRPGQSWSTKYNGAMYGTPVTVLFSYAEDTCDA